MEQLYTETLPQVRSRLRQQGMKQVGSIKMNMDADLFQKNKYKRSTSAKHDPYHVKEYNQDPSLQAFMPKQWTGKPLPPAQDDLMNQTLKGLTTVFKLKQVSLRRGDKLHYEWHIRMSTQHPIILKITMNVAQPSNMRVISYSEKTAKLSGEQQTTKIEGVLYFPSEKSALGTYAASAQVYAVIRDEFQERMVLLTMHGPIPFHLIE